MFILDEIEYSRLDVSAMLEMRGIALVDVLRAKACERWLAAQGYVLAKVDFGISLHEALTQLGSVLNWERQFGYAMQEGHGNLNALADGFSFPISSEGGHVLVVNGPELLAATESSWFDGFLEIASAHSLLHLACGSKFFLLLIVARESPLPGHTYATSRLPATYWNPNARRHGFLE